jgi:ABC-type Fe3+ transport system substrate-binding protein
MGMLAIFSRFRSEVATGGPTADIPWSLATDLQLILINEGHALPYKLTFYDKIPLEAEFKDLAYVTSYALFAPIFNKEKIPRDLWPRSYGDILNLLATRRELFPKGSICSFDPIRSGFALVAQYYQYKTMEPYFTMMYSRAGEIGAQLHAASGPQIERVRTGECVYVFI